MGGWVSEWVGSRVKTTPFCYLSTRATWMVGGWVGRGRLYVGTGR